MAGRNFGITIMLLLAGLFSQADNRALAQQAGGTASEGTLATVTMFAFGGVGFAGSQSPGEKDYHAIMSRPNSLEILERLLGSATPEAKSYALVGIYKLNRARFEVLATTLQPSKVAVHMGRGCILSQTTLGAIVQSIEAGTYKQYL